ncbi:hypothetical protein HHL17_09130 [Chitinophaga sp. G-6-1-13]|uniref:RNA polymerase sigma-70 region 2 domain-containing protein n=1 Tax=Chitinophaga fulva TaxID=2728842 RepID=A0A848GIX8_9BACT|nr:hypothetical protein [Chitinophaga fulva]NML37359.1 hypothetical protein [Chitinophaga fulva]
MNCKTNDKLSPIEKDIIIIPGDLKAFENFVDTYQERIFAAIARLSGEESVCILEKITIDVFVELWQQKVQFIQERSIGILIYKTCLRHTLLYLRQHGFEERIQQLKDILPCKEPFSVLENL